MALVRHPEKKELNRETTMYCSPDSSKIFGTPCVLCTVYLERPWDCLGNFSIIIFIALMRACIPQSPDNFKRVIKYQTSHTPFYSRFKSVANIVSSFETSFRQRSIKSHLTVAIT